MDLQIESNEDNKDEEEGDRGGNKSDKYTLDKTKSIKILYNSMHGTGGTIWGGISFGELLVYAKTTVGSGTPLNGVSLFLTFKCIVFHSLLCRYRHTRT